MSDILAIAEHRRSVLRDVSYELLTAGKELADTTGGTLHTAVISGAVEKFADQLNREGVEAIHTVEYGEEFNHDVYVQAVEQLADDLDSQYILAPNTINGLDYAPAVAQRLGLPLVTDATAIDASEGLTVTRELYGGKTEGDVDVKGESALVTIRPTEWSAIEDVGDATIDSFDADIREEGVRSTVKGFEEVGTGCVDISEADMLVSVGRGIEEEENLDVIFNLAEAMDATVSASRPIVDNGWLPQDRQVGQLGKVVTPDVYIAIGIPVPSSMSLV